MALRAHIDPLLERNFSWPSILEIQLGQEQSCTGSLEMTSSDGVLMFMNKVCVPRPLGEAVHGTAPTKPSSSLRLSFYSENTFWS
jgi:hypothetical protein